MKKIIISLLAFILLPLVAHASGKMMISEGENVIISADSDLSLPEFKWTLLKNDEIVLSQTGKIFTQMFQTAEHYVLNLTVISMKTNDIETTSIEIIVGATNEFKDSLDIDVQTLPALNNNNIVPINEQNLNVHFILSGSKGNIKEYKIDADIKKDTDDDEILDNDIDNLYDDSFQDGRLWTYSYSLKDLPTKAKLTVVGIDGTKDDKEIAIEISSKKTVEKVKAILDTYPTISSDKRVHISGDETKILVYSANSLGNIVEYRIDTNIKEDSDEDGNPENDIDNLSHLSFTTGELFETNLKRAYGNVIIQLIVVSKDGKGSKIQRKFVWDTDKKKMPESGIRIFADRTQVFVGDKVYFGVEGFGSAMQGFEIKWDYNNDKEVDYVSTESNLATHIYDIPGDYEVLSQVKNEERKILKYAKLNIQVKEKPENLFNTTPPISNFDIKVTSNKVEFKNQSIIDNNLSKDEVKYEWKFGDGQTSIEENPVYLYKEARRYVARLTVTDSTGQNHTKHKLVEITKVDPTLSLNGKGNNIIEGDDKKDDIVKKDEKIIEDKDNFNKKPIENKKEEIPEITTNDTKTNTSFLMLVIWGILIFIGSAFGLILVYLIILKINHPDYTFGEIVEEEKEKVLSILEGRKYEPPNGEIIATGEKIKKATSEILDKSDKNEQMREKLKADESKEIKKSDTNTTVKPLEVYDDGIVGKDDKSVKESNASLNDDVPDWLKDASEGNTSSSNQENNSNNDNSSKDEDIPDWLK